MAAAGALNVVKQIQALAEGPRTPEMRECLGQVVSSLLFFLDHPDSRVRLSSARTLVKLTKGYAEDVHRFDLSRARSALARCKKLEAEGSTSIDTEEFHRLLEEMFESASASETRPDIVTSSSVGAAVRDPMISGTSSAASSTTAVGVGGTAAVDDRGQVVLKVGLNTDGKLKAAILEKVVVLAGVVSVTFEGPFVIVATKTPTIAADAAFLADLLTALRAQGLQGVSLVSTAAAGTAAASDARAFGQATPQVESGAGGSAGSRDTAAVAEVAQVEEEEEDDDEAEPAYLDDDEDEPVGAGGGLPGGGPGAVGPVGAGLGGNATWSFFSQSNWMTGRRLQEFGDDPTIAARLAKAKKREEEKREEERSRIGRISSWLMGGR